MENRITPVVEDNDKATEEVDEFDGYLLSPIVVAEAEKAPEEDQVEGDFLQIPAIVEEEPTRMENDEEDTEDGFVDSPYLAAEVRERETYDEDSKTTPISIKKRRTNSFIKSRTVLRTFLSSPLLSSRRPSKITGEGRDAELSKTKTEGKSSGKAKKKEKNR